MSEYVEARSRHRKPEAPELHHIEIGAVAGDDGDDYQVVHHFVNHPSAEHRYRSKREVLDHLAQHIPDNEGDE